MLLHQEVNWSAFYIFLLKNLVDLISAVNCIHEVKRECHESFLLYFNALLLEREVNFKRL